MNSNSRSLPMGERSLKALTMQRSPERSTPNTSAFERRKVIMAARPKVVMIGAGFGGLWAAKALADKDVDVVVIDRRNHHVFQPLLYQVATAVLSPGEIAQPIRRILHRHKNIEVVLGEAVEVDTANKQVVLGDGV